MTGEYGCDSPPSPPPLMPKCLQRWHWGRGGVLVGVTRGVVCEREVGVGPGSVWAFGAFGSE